MKIKLRRRDPAPVGEDLNSILAALEANNPEDAQAARQAPSAAKRQDDLNSILAALEANNPEDAQAARQGSA
jgi:DNA-binding FadR family transcriptional regulator